MPKRWTLYWVSSGTDEDCFVVARNCRSAARVEIEMNGFDPEQIDVERICVIPKSVENDYFERAHDHHHPWPGYVFGREFFEGVGAEFRRLDGRLQMLLNEAVYDVEEFSPCSIQRKYLIGSRSIRSFESVPEFIDMNLEYEDPDYFGSIGPFVHEILGKCLTFGQLIAMIKRDWEMIPELDAGLDVYRHSRNLFVHRLCTDPRYDISTRWGVMEFLPFLQFFDLQTKIIMRASQASLAASIGLVLNQFGAPGSIDPELLGPEHEERVSAFFEMFWIKGAPWGKSAPSQSKKKASTVVRRRKKSKR